MNKKIISALSSLGIPVAFLEYNGPKDNYILFSVINEQDSDFSDDENSAEISYVTISHWYKNPSDMAKNKTIKNLMKQAGFIFDGDGQDLKEDDYYGKNYDFIYKEYL